MTNFVTIEKGLGPEGRIAVVRFDRGDGINALSPEAMRQLTNAARSFEDDGDTSAGTRIKTAFRGACKRAGIINFTPHGCRHTWATWHYIANRDLKKLQVLGGWKTLSMVLRYAHTNVDEHKGSIDALPGGNLGEGETAEAKSA